MQSTLIEAYRSLLADLEHTTVEPFIRAHYDVTEEWVLIEAPKLDKAIWHMVENVESDVKNGLIGPLDPEHPKGLFGNMVDKYFSHCDISPSPLEMKDWLTELCTLMCAHMSARSLGVPYGTLGLFLRNAHQSLVFCYKAEYEPTKDQLKDAYRVFEENDASIDIFNQYFNRYGKSSVLTRTARSLVSRVIYKADWQEVAPRHGPGAVYPSEKSESKGNFLSYYPTIDDCYPYSSWMHGMPTMWERLWSSPCMKQCDEIVCRIQAVPKDSRGPRLICVHPKEAVWTQQGTRHVLEHAIASSPLTNGKINFHDQSVNGRLALEASATRDFCTLDLKDASDRLSCDVVSTLFGEHAYRHLSCSRATKVRIDDRVISLRKFAPMGNALTFPVQSLCFWAMVRAGILVTHGINCDDVYVFGDDIIFPSKYYRGAVGALTRFGLITNANKTFYKGSFRESCGIEAFDGLDITPLRMKVRELKSVTDALALNRLAIMATQRGHSRLSAFLYRLIEGKYGKLAFTNNPNTQGLNRYEDLSWDRLLLLEPTMRFNRKGQQRWEVPTKLVIQGDIVLKKHEWFHVQDSLIGLWRRYDAKGFTEVILSDNILSSKDEVRQGPVVYSDRGLVYPDPRRLRLVRGWTEVIMK